MKRVFATFERIENAKAAVGRVKKEAWNQADFAIIISGESAFNVSGDDRFEFGDEHFLDSPYSRNYSKWPSLQDKEIEGIGRVKMAVSFKQHTGSDLSEETVMIDKELAADNLKKKKVIAIIETEDDIIPKIETILESEGAEVIIFE